jgi:hypothetical protein
MAEGKTLGSVASRASRTSFAFPSSKVKHLKSQRFVIGVLVSSALIGGGFSMQKKSMLKRHPELLLASFSLLLLIVIGLSAGWIIPAIDADAASPSPLSTYCHHHSASCQSTNRP